MNDFVGASIAVEFDAVEGSDVGCTDSVTGTYVVQNGGAVTAQSGAPVLVNSPAGVTSSCSYDVTFPEYIEPEPGASVGKDREALYLRSSVVATVVATRRAVSASYNVTHGHSGELTSFDPNVTASVPRINVQGSSQFSEARIWLSYSSDTAGCHNKVFEKYSVSSTGEVTAVGDVIRLDKRPSGATTGDVCGYKVDFAKSSNDLLGLGSNIIRPTISETSTNREVMVLVIVLERVSTSDTRCSSRARLSYSVSAGGEVVEDFAPDMIYAKYIDSEPCNYTATITANSGIQITQGAGAVTVSIDDPSPRVVFTATPST